MSQTNEPQPTQPDAAASSDVAEEAEPISTQPTQEEPTTPEPTQEESTQEESTQEESTQEEPTQEEPTQEAIAEPPVAAPPAPTPASIPKPSAVPTPAALAKSVPRPMAPAAPAPIVTDHSASAAFGRVDENGTVFVRTKEGEKEVGSYPGATPEEALAYFARKYDELYASAVLLEQRLAQPEVPAKDVADALKALTAQVNEASVVGDLEALATQLDTIQSGIAAKRTVEQQHRAEARAAAAAERERIVAEAESIAAQPENRIQWKQSGARMRELLDEWKSHQRAATRLDRETETALWQRFSAARNRFDKARRTHFATLDASHAEAKAAKERLVAEALGESSGVGDIRGQDYRGAGKKSRRL